MAVHPVQPCWRSLLCLLLGLSLVPGGAPCTLPAYLRSVFAWSSRIQQWGAVKDRQYDFDEHHMNVSIDTPQPQPRSFLCHQAMGNDTFILSETKDNATLFKCVRFDRWSPYVVQIWESTNEPKSSPSLCSEGRLVADRWPLIWERLNLGYVPCPAIGGYDMDVLNSDGASLCWYVNPVPKLRFESECVEGEGIIMEFRLSLCKGDNIRLSNTAHLLCLGHRQFGGYTHVVAIEKRSEQKILMLRYSQTNSSVDMHLFGDIVIETEEVIPRSTAHISLKRRIYDSICVDNYHNCLAPETCYPRNILNCQSTCRNFTTCVEDGGACQFDRTTFGRWIEQTSAGTRIINITNKTADLATQGSFECLNIYSSTNTGPKPIVKVMSNGCKPRYACLDAEVYSSSVMKYRLSEIHRWPYKDNLLRGDLCGETSFTDMHHPRGPHYQSQHTRMLIRASKSGRSSRRSTVACNLESAINFSASSNCSGTLRSCKSGHTMVMTFGRGCTQIPSHRVFYRCLAAFKTPWQKYTVTEQVDDPEQLHCWVQREDPFGFYPNVLLQLRAADCTNGTRVAKAVRDKLHILRLEFSSHGQDGSSESCLDMPTPPLPTAPAELPTTGLKPTEATLSPTLYKMTINSTGESSPASPSLKPQSTTGEASSTHLPSRPEVRFSGTSRNMSSSVRPNTTSAISTEGNGNSSTSTLPSAPTKPTALENLTMRSVLGPTHNVTLDNSTQSPGKGAMTENNPVNSFDVHPASVYASAAHRAHFRWMWLPLVGVITTILT